MTHTQKRKQMEGLISFITVFHYKPRLPWTSLQVTLGHDLASAFPVLELCLNRQMTHTFSPPKLLIYNQVLLMC